MEFGPKVKREIIAKGTQIEKGHGPDTPISPNIGRRIPLYESRPRTPKRKSKILVYLFSRRCIYICTCVYTERERGANRERLPTSYDVPHHT